MTEPRQHHFVPRFYLSGFVDPEAHRRDKKEFLWVYERGKAVRRSSPENEATQRDFYSFDQDGSRNVEIEAWLGRLESCAAPIIASLMGHARNITEQEKETLALFIGTMQMRTPAGRHLSETRIEPIATKLMKDAASDAERFRAFVDENDLNPEGEEFDLEEIRRDILAGGGERLSTRQHLKLISIIEIGKMAAQILSEMSWQLIYSEDEGCFLTSDDPVIAIRIDEQANKLRLRAGIRNPGVNVLFPLSRSLCVRIAKGIEPGYGRWVPAGIRYVNKIIAICADRWVYAAERSEKIKTLFDGKGGRPQF